MDDQFLRIYLTLRCTMKCPYCAVYGGSDPAVYGRYPELSAVEWLQIIKKVGRDVILSGGEPFLHKGLPEIVAGIPEELIVRIYTNLSINPGEFINVVQRRTGFLVSYHPHAIGLDRFRAHLERLAGNERFSGLVHAVDAPAYADELAAAAEFVQTLGERWRWQVNDDINTHPELTSAAETKTVRCESDRLILAPDGVRYPCPAWLLERNNALEDLKVCETVATMAVMEACSRYGRCSICDVQNFMSGRRVAIELGTIEG